MGNYRPFLQGPLPVANYTRIIIPGRFWTRPPSTKSTRMASSATPLHDSLIELAIPDAHAHAIKWYLKVESLKVESLTNESLTSESLKVESLKVESLTNESLTSESLKVESLTWSSESFKVESLTNESLKVESLRIESLTVA